MSEMIVLSLQHQWNLWRTESFMFWFEWIFNQLSSDLTTAWYLPDPSWDWFDISKSWGYICLPAVYSLYTERQHLIKGESNLSSSTDRRAFWCTLRLISCACCDINRAILALTCKQCEQTGKYSAEWNALHLLSPLGKSYYSCQTLKILKFSIFRLYSTVLQNFSKKSRNTVSVREGQAVVLLCGPPPHYGGTVLCPNYSALSAVVSHSCLPQQSLLFPTLLLIISL